MSTKEQAKEMIERFDGNKRYALIAATYCKEEISGFDTSGEMYWEEVIEEIENYKV